MRIPPGYVVVVNPDTSHTPAELLAYLDRLAIPHRTVEHAPLFTVADAKLLRRGLPGGHSKSLFLKNKKGRLWLIVVDEDQLVDLDVLATTLGSNRLSFASEARLARHLGVTPGAVTPFAVINDPDHLVTVALGEKLLGHDPLNFHPLVNDQTTTIATKDLLRFLDATGHPVRILAEDELH